MAELYPYPFGALITRMFRELEQHDAIFDLPRRKFFLGTAGKDFGVSFHGHQPSSALGPAAGPQSQLAQNIVLSYLCGGRIMELKTVQIMDELEIPRPCIDMQTIGYNVEWSQELKLEQSLDEYVKASMLIEILVASGKLALADGFDRVTFDMSVGYDLKGIRSEPVQAFIRGMQDASDVVERFRQQIPEEYKAFRDLDFTTKLADTLTLSTFHGCPPDEIEKIIDFLFRENGLNCIVKLNPMLLGPKDARGLLNDTMGYDDVHIPETAFERDASWEQAQGIVERLGTTAEELGLGFGVKFSNTLIVENHRDFFPASEKEMYLSGAPLHVLAMNLVRKFRQRFGDRYPISFSAGIDRGNFADAVAIGLTPITVCSDLLKPGGYGRASGYMQDLAKKMDKLGATHIDDYIIRAYGHGEAALDAADVAPAVREKCLTALTEGGDLREAAGDAYAKWVSQAKLLNTDDYVARATEDDRYKKVKNSKPPRKIGSHLDLFDCITCDKCIPVCPNDANFAFDMPKLELPLLKVFKRGDAWQQERLGTLAIEQKHQIGNFADFCNECGNCDIFCPEDGGPYVVKPRFFGSLEAWKTFPQHDGFFFEGGSAGDVLYGRFASQAFELVANDGGEFEFRGDGFKVAFAGEDPAGTIRGEADGSVDLTYFFIMNKLREMLLDESKINYVNMLAHA